MTPTERRVVDRLKRRRVERFAELAKALDVSPKTVQRALAQVEHLTSVNRNAAYVALAEAARFDERGLWRFEKTCFSRHGNLPQNRLVEGCCVGRATARRLSAGLGKRAGARRRVPPLRPAPKHVEQPLLLAAALRGETSDISPAEGTLQREVLLAFHHWILDYAGDGQRQGFPFDPYLLYFHRRVVRAADAIGKLLSDPQLRQSATRVLINFEKMLRDYLADPKVIEAARQYEVAFEVFAKLRTVLRLVAGGEQPLRDRYLLEEAEREQVRQSLSSLREEFRQQATDDDAQASGACAMVVQHLDRYWQRLFVPGGANRDRTTNGLEGHWGAAKRNCRERHGRKTLTLDFRSLPAEFMLIPNLQNSAYVELVVGNLDNLPCKLASAGRTAGPCTPWRRQHHPLSLGRLPRRLLRQENLIDNLITLYNDNCQNEPLDVTKACPASKSHANRISE
jgi:DNA-binding CsgD family transcriptional regulator